MNIESIDTFVVSLPERRPHLMSTITQKQGNYVIVRVRSDDGLVGLGEATVLKEWGGDYGRYYGEHPSTTRLIIAELLAPELVGEDPRNIGFLLDKLDRAVKGYPYAKASIDLALHDLVGKAYGVSVTDLLGGVWRERIPVAHSLGILEMEPLLTEVSAAVEEGIRTIKLKGGIDPARDVSVVRRVRDLVGDAVDITVDANNGWPDAKTAIRTIRAMEDQNVLFVEQPVEGLRSMWEVTQAVDTHVMADESAWTPRDVLEIAKLGAANAISVYTTKPGGLHRAMKTAAVAEAAGLLCNVNGSAETGVGNAANLHLAAAARVISQACVVPISAPAESAPTKVAGRFYLDDIITQSFVYASGFLEVPRGPGLGVELDEEKIARYSQRD